MPRSSSIFDVTRWQSDLSAARIRKRNSQSLDFPVGFSDNGDVMSDSWGGIPAPPAPSEPARASEPVRSIYSFSEAEVGDYLLVCLRRVNRLPTLGEHPDGSPAIKSVIGAWLISQVGGLVNRKRLVNLAKLSREERLRLRSVAGVAFLIRRALTAIQAPITAA